MTTTQPPNDAPNDSPENAPENGEPNSGAASATDRPGLGQSAVAGLLAAGSALAAGELAGSLAAPVPGPVIGVANRVIDLAPQWFVEFGKSVFGLADKPALVLGTIIVSLVFGTALGVASRRRAAIGMGGIAAFGLVGLIAIGTDAQGSWIAAIVVSTVAVAAGIGALRLLIAANVGEATVQSGLRPPTNSTSTVPSPADPPVSRRSFLNWAGVVGATVAVAAVGSRQIRSRSSAAQARDAIDFTATTADSASTEIETVVSRAASGPVGSTPGITPLVVPSNDFYLIDTALTTPQVDPNNWSLTIRGLVDNETTYTYDELLDRSDTIAPVTLSCVSNEVGGDLVGNAIWRGVPLVDLLEEAGVKPEATQIASRSVDGWSCGFPTEAAFDGRTALVAVGMNDEPLPLKHGFPARLVVSGLYGYVSATKWLAEIELTTLDDFDGYWIPRGWSKLGPVKTQSRIDTPGNGQQIEAGSELAIAGVAWAPSTGIAKVEVRIDENDWMEADLGESLGPDAWRQWVVGWEATEGQHIVEVRATDESGETQTPDFAPPAPDGASGWHRIRVMGV